MPVPVSVIERTARAVVAAATILSATAVGLVVDPSSPPAAAVSAVDNAAIADRALAYVNRFGGAACADAGFSGYGGVSPLGDYDNMDGECRSFVNCVVKLATGQNIAYGSDDYHRAFRDNGAQQVARDSGTKGDVIQVGNGVHTAIVVRNLGGGTYEVVDSNWVARHKVGVHNYTIPADGVIWRLGTVRGGNAAAYAGHIVQWDGDTKAQKTAWYVTPDHRRIWISSIDAYNGLKRRGVPGPVVLPASTLDQLPDQWGKWAPGFDRLDTNQVLRRGMHLKSGDGRYTLWLQIDGNTVLYGPSGRALWANYRYATNFVIMQGDGNFVSYTDGGSPTWASNTGGRGAGTLVVQNDGNLVVYAGGRAVWASNTAGRT